MGKTQMLTLSLVALGGFAMFAQEGKKSRQDPDGHSEGLPVENLPRLEFSMHDSLHVRETIQRRELAIQAATAVLASRAEGKPIDEDLVCRAADLLGKLRADDNRAIKALVANIDFRPSVSIVGEPNSLETLDAAQALRQIGSRAVVEELHRALLQQRTEKEHLIVAHLLIACDGLDVAAYRLSRVIETEKASKRPDQDYISHLESVKYWLDNSSLLRHPDNWPSTM